MTGAGDDAGAVVPQRLVLVLPSTAEFDSRTYRIASAAAARGHVVTVIARWAPGLPRTVEHPAGYRIQRVAADPWPVVPGGGSLRRLRDRLRGGGRRPVGGPGHASLAATQSVSNPAEGPARSVAATGPASAARSRGGRPVAMARAAVRGGVRLTAIWLSIRAQTRSARRVDPGADLYHGMAYMGIPVAASLAGRRGAPVIYDARDIYVDAGNLARLPRIVRAVVGWAERRRARAASRVVTVNEPYAEVMATRWGVTRPLVVLNCAYRYEPAEPRERRFHRLLGLAESTPVVLYHGGLSPERGIEQLIEAIRLVPGAVLVLMGYGPLRDRIEALAADPSLGGRVRFAPPVSPDVLLDWIAAADIVAMPIQGSTLNHRLTTPNKLLEAIAAGVPVVASDLPGMAPIVRETGAGLLVDPADPAAIAGAIQALVDDPAERLAAGRRALAAAHDRYHWEAQLAILLAEYGRLTGRPW